MCQSRVQNLSRLIALCFLKYSVGTFLSLLFKALIRIPDISRLDTEIPVPLAFISFENKAKKAEPEQTQ